ncbi:D-alanyl-D-alanine carboxypeptidase family protein [Thalassotalea euphylliae]|uniref:D-alanyl-D-alanine carboxypeptidase family protein n=1 Tax=Thalassotalea euphylliae TaxID=1655234 RepID=A0A3E0TQ33_9GAMM|nr:M15 family metallopeptidase [Thalassotalea euphylliae]REL26741.1 D-alanyl-D-alanine carboxypeptidase family protein [Thalassotalea euphylliae]
MSKQNIATFSKLALTGKSDNHIHWLNERHGIHHQVLNDWQAMAKSAEKDGLHLTLVSGFRSFERQMAIWNRKFNGQLPVLDEHEKPLNMASMSDLAKITAIMLFSALPGASRHHWGSDIDVYAPNLLADDQTLQLEQWEYQTDGPMAQLSLWLQENAKHFGFYFPYDKFRGGVAAEPWHLSHSATAAGFQAALTTSVLADAIANSGVAGKATIIEHLDMLYHTYITNIGDYPNG